MSELPRGWVVATLGDLFEITSSKRVHQHDWTESGVPFYRAREVKKLAREGYVENELFISEELFQKYAAEFGAPVAGDLMVTAVGTLGECYRVTQADRFYFKDASVLWFRRGVKVDSEFIARIFATREVLAQVHKGGGTTVGTYTIGSAKETVVPLPPLAEQKRIVAKLDELSAKSARARTELARIETLVSRYKHAVLSKAFSGGLTSDLYAEADGNRGSGHPPHWKQMQLGEIADIKSGVTLGKKRKPDEQLLELPYLRVANVQRGWLDLREIKTIEVTAREADALFLREGDVLMNEGGDRDKLGRGWVWDGQITDCIHQNHVFRVRLTSGTVPPRFLSYYANEFGQKHFFDEGKQTTNLASISKSKLAAMTVPIPPFEEAMEIVRSIESAFARMARLAAEAKRARELVARLDEAILAKAFRGELVPQDENDEPAELLLARIRAEREAAPKATRRTRNATSKLTADRKRTTEMAMMRDDVEKDHLSQILRVAGGTKTPRDLWLQSGMDIDEFYKQLRSEMDLGQIREGANKDQLELVDAH